MPSKPPIPVGPASTIRDVIDKVERGPRMNAPEGDIVAYVIPVGDWRQYRAILSGVAEAFDA
jgi:hypothetical protein